MKILFAGHRDRFCDESALADIYQKYPEAIWLHGGATGFDMQVENYAQKHAIRTIVFPNEDTKYGQYTPVERMDKMIKASDRVIALWDGRTKGGTYYVIGKARSAGKLLSFIPKSKIRRQA